jgi:hypothetical protein
VPACNAKLAAIYYLRYFLFEKGIIYGIFLREVLSVVLPVPKEYKNTAPNSAIYRRDPNNENTAGICQLVYGPGFFGPFGSNPRFQPE